MNRKERIAHNQAISKACNRLGELSTDAGEAARTCRVVGMVKEAEHLTVIMSALSTVVPDIRKLMVIGEPDEQEN